MSDKLWSELTPEEKRIKTCLLIAVGEWRIKDLDSEHLELLNIHEKYPRENWVREQIVDILFELLCKIR